MHRRELEIDIIGADKTFGQLVGEVLRLQRHLAQTYSATASGPCVSMICRRRCAVIANGVIHRHGQLLAMAVSAQIGALHAARRLSQAPGRCLIPWCRAAQNSRDAPCHLTLWSRGRFPSAAQYHSPPRNRGTGIYRCSCPPRLPILVRVHGFCQSARTFFTAPASAWK